MSKERRLGRGLEALLGRAAGEEATPGGFAQPAPAASTISATPANYRVHVPTPDPVDAEDQILKLSVYEIDNNPFQPRRDFDDQQIDAMVDSLEEHGLIQPVLVRRVGERYQLIAGERRLRSAIKAGWSEIPAQVREADDRQVAEIAIVENLQRKDLNAIEKAASFQQYLEQYRCTQEELAKRLQIDRSTVANLIRLLELPEAVQAAVRGGQITQGHARALLPLGEEREQIDFCQRIQAEGLSVRATEELVGEIIRHGDTPEPSTPEASPVRQKRAAASKQVGVLEQEFRNALGTKVDVKQTTNGRGRVIVHFTSNEEFERLRSFLCEDRGYRSQAS